MELSESEYKILTRYRSTTMEGDNATKGMPKSEYLCFGGTGKIDRSATCVFELLYDGDNTCEDQRGQDQQKDKVIDPREGLERILGSTFLQAQQHKVADESVSLKSYSSLLGDCPLRTIQRNTVIIPKNQCLTIENTNQLDKKQQSKVLRDISSLEDLSEDSADQEVLFDLSEQQYISQQNLEDATLNLQKQQQQQEKLNRSRETYLSRMIDEFNKTSRIQIAGIKHFEGRAQKIQNSTQAFVKKHNLPHFNQQYQHDSLSTAYSCASQSRQENHEGERNINKRLIEDKENQQTNNQNNNYINNCSSQSYEKILGCRRQLSKGTQLEQTAKQIKEQSQTTTAISTLQSKSDQYVNSKQKHQHMGYLEGDILKQQFKQLDTKLPPSSSRIPKKKTDQNCPIKKNRCQSGNSKQNNNINSSSSVIVSSIKGPILKDNSKKINSSTRI